MLVGLNGKIICKSMCSSSIFGETENFVCVVHQEQNRSKNLYETLSVYLSLYPLGIPHQRIIVYIIV